MKNKRYMVNIIIFILIALTSIIFLYWKGENEVYNSRFVNINELLDISGFEEQNAGLIAYKEFTIIIDSEIDKYDYYLYNDRNVYDNHLSEKTLIIFTNEIDEKDYFSWKFKGVAKKINKDKKDNIINSLSENYGLNISSSEFDEYFYDIYLDATEVKVKNTLLPYILSIIVLLVGILGVIVNIIFLIKNNKDKITQKKVFRLIFIISFIPYILLLGLALYNSIFGFTFFSTAYGFEAFILTILLYGMIFSIYPVLPIVLIYQIIYKIFKIILKNKKFKD